MASSEGSELLEDLLREVISDDSVDLATWMHITAHKSPTFRDEMREHTVYSPSKMVEVQSLEEYIDLPDGTFAWFPVMLKDVISTKLERFVANSSMFIIEHCPCFCPNEPAVFFVMKRGEPDPESSAIRRELFKIRRSLIAQKENIVRCMHDDTALRQQRIRSFFST